MISKVIDIAKEAGKVIKEGFSDSISIEYKTDVTNIVTNVDKAAEKIITDFITKEYPTHSIIAEESGKNIKSSEYTWVIDPLDGTTNFVHKLPNFAVSIGLQKNNETILAVIYDVFHDIVYSAEKGAGSFENIRKMSVNDNSNIIQSALVTGFEYDRKDKYREALRLFEAFLLKARAVRIRGAAALDFCYVASGIFDGYWEVNLSPWDVCAGVLIVKEAGGVVTDFHNNTISIFSNQFLATNGKIHDRMIEVINTI